MLGSIYAITRKSINVVNAINIIGEAVCSQRLPCDGRLYLYKDLWIIVFQVKSYSINIYFTIPRNNNLPNIKF